MWDMKVNSSAAINLIAQQLSHGICPFWASLPCVPDFRKICPFRARLINVAENSNEKRKISYPNLIYFCHYGRQWVQEIFIFCIASTRLLGRHSTKCPHRVGNEFLLMRGRQNMHSWKCMCTAAWNFIEGRRLCTPGLKLRSSHGCFLVRTRVDRVAKLWRSVERDVNKTQNQRPSLADTPPSDVEGNLIRANDTTTTLYGRLLHCGTFPRCVMPLFAGSAQRQVTASTCLRSSRHMFRVSYTDRWVDFELNAHVSLTIYLSRAQATKLLVRRETFHSQGWLCELDPASGINPFCVLWQLVQFRATDVTSTLVTVTSAWESVTLLVHEAVRTRVRKTAHCIRHYSDKIASVREVVWYYGNITCVATVDFELKFSGISNAV